MTFHPADLTSAGSCTLQPGPGDGSRNSPEHLGSTRGRPGMADAKAPRVMTFEYAAGIALALLLFVYLVYALLLPERF